MRRITAQLSSIVRPLRSPRLRFPGTLAVLLGLASGFGLASPALSQSTTSNQHAAQDAGVKHYSRVLPARHDFAAVFAQDGAPPSLFFIYKVASPRDCLLPLTPTPGEAWNHICKLALENGGFLRATAALTLVGQTPPLYTGTLKGDDGTDLAKVWFDDKQQANVTMHMLDNPRAPADARSPLNPGTLTIGAGFTKTVIGSSDFGVSESRFYLETDRASFSLQRDKRNSPSSARNGLTLTARMLPDAECPGPGAVWQGVCDAAKASATMARTFQGEFNLSEGQNLFAGRLRVPAGSTPSLWSLGIEPDAGKLRVALGWPSPAGFDALARDFQVGINPNDIFVGQLSGFWRPALTGVVSFQYRMTPVDRRTVDVEVRAFAKDDCRNTAGQLKRMCELLEKDGPASARGQLLGSGDGVFALPLQFQTAQGDAEMLNHRMHLTHEEKGQANVRIDRGGTVTDFTIVKANGWDDLGFEPSLASSLASVAGKWISKPHTGDTVVYEMDIVQGVDNTFDVVLQGFKEPGPYNPPNSTYARLEEKMDKGQASLRTTFNVTANEQDWGGQMSWPNTFGPYDAGMQMYPRGGRLLLKLGERDNATFEDGRVFEAREGPMTNLSDQPPPPVPSGQASLEACAKIEPFVAQVTRFQTLAHILESIGETVSADGKVDDCASATALMDSLGLDANGTVVWPTAGEGTLIDQLASGSNGGTMVLQGSGDAGTMTVTDYAGCMAETDAATCGALSEVAGQSLSVSGVIPAGDKGYGVVSLGGLPHLAIIDATVEPKRFSLARDVVVLSSILGAVQQSATAGAMCNGVSATVIPRPTLADGTPIAVCTSRSGCMDGASSDAEQMRALMCSVYAPGFLSSQTGSRGPSCLTKGAAEPSSVRFGGIHDVMAFDLMNSGSGMLPTIQGGRTDICPNCEIVEELRCAN